MNKRLPVLAFCLLVVGSYVLYKGINTSHGGQNSKNLARSVATVKDIDNEVQTRKAQSLIWDDAKPADGLRYYDSILTKKNSHSKLELSDGTELEMGPDSLIVLEPPFEKQSGMKLDLKQGTAIIQIKKGEKIETKNNLIVAKQDATIKISSDVNNLEDTIFVEEKPVKGANSSEQPPKTFSPIEIMEIQKPNPQASNLRGASQRVPSQQHSEILRAPVIKMRHQTFKIETPYQKSSSTKTLLQKVALLFFPEAEAQTNEGVARLKWENLPKASGYEVEFSTNKEFKNIIMTKTTKYNTTIWDSPSPGTYFWRVRAMDQDGLLGNLSEVASFTVVVLPEEISASEASQSRVVAQEPTPIAPPLAPTTAQESPPVTTQAPGLVVSPTKAAPLSKTDSTPNGPPVPKRDQLLITPHIFYSEIAGTDIASAQTAKFYSTLNSGIDFKFIENYGDRWAAAVHYGIINQNFSAPSNKVISNISQLDSSLGGEVTDHVKRELSFSLAADYAQEIFFSSSSITNISFDSIFIPELSLKGDYDFTHYKLWTLAVGAGATLLLPGSSNAYTINLGSKYYGTLNVRRDLGRVQTILGICYSSQNQSTSIATQFEQNLDLYLKVGF